MTEVFDQVAQIPQVNEVSSPYAQGGARQIAPDAPIAYAQVTFNVEFPDITSETRSQLNQVIHDANAPGIQVEGGGSVFTKRELPGGTEAIGLLAAVVILLIAFGSVLAMGLPILTALFGIGVGFAIVELLSHATSVPEFATQLAAMIGIGVGIDYALFIVTRYRQGLHEGLDPETSVVTALDTAGRAVLFAGTTVVISLLGMLLIGISFVGGLGVGAAAVVGITMIASITLLPALLGFVGRKIDKLKLPGTGKMRDPRTTAGYRWSHFLQRHPWPFAALGLAILVGLALPVVSIRLGSSDESNSPTTMTTRRAYDLKAEGFGPGASGPLLLAAQIGGQQDLPTLQKVVDEIKATPGVAFGEPAPTERDRRRRHHPGHPDDVVAGRGHGRPHRPPPPRRAARGHRGHRRRGPRRWRHRRLRRRGHQAAEPPPAVHRRGARAQLPAAHGRVPVDRRADQGGDHEPAVDRRRLRPDGGRVPVGLGQGPHRRRQGRARSRASCR